MAQTGYTPISIYYSATATNTPTAGNLVAGELAINTADGKLFYKDSSGVVQTIASKNGVAGGSNTQVQYNSSGSLAGSANMTFSGTALTLANDASISGLTVGKGGGSLTNNTAVGANALSATNTGSGLNTAVGVSVLASNTSGQENSAFGVSSLGSNTTGSYNVGIGRSALASNTTASNNTAVGYQAGYSNTTTGGLTAIGRFAGYAYNGATEVNGSLFVGNASGYLTTTGHDNTFVGASSGYFVTTGSKNTVLGQYTGNQGGLDIRTASNYIVLSDGDGNPRGVFDGSGNFLINTTSATAGASNGKLVVGFNGSTGNGLKLNDTDTSASSNNSIVFIRNGSSVGSITTTTTTTAYVTSSDYRLKENVVPMTGALNKLANLKPVTYSWKSNGEQAEGFIAHELAEVCPLAVSGEKDAVDAEGNPVYQGIDTSFLVATLTAAIQELKAEFDAYKATHP